MSAWQRLPRIQKDKKTQLTTSRSRSYLPPCLVARAGRKHLPVGTLKSQARKSVIEVPTFGPRKSVRSTGPVGGMMGALVVNLTCDVRRVAKLPSEPWWDASDGLNTWTVRIQTRELRRTPLGKESLHCKTHLCKGIVKSYRTPALHGLAPFPPHLEPKAPQKHLISKVSKPFGQSLPNPWLSQLRGKISFSRQNIEPRK